VPVRSIPGVVLVWLLVGVGCQSTPVEPVETPALRVGVFGASMSAGYGADVSLSDLFDECFTVPALVLDQSSLFFFMDPHSKGKIAIQKLLDQRVDVLIGVDYLFWFGYGKKTMEERLRGLDVGFEVLEGIECRILLGDLPDGNEATAIRDKSKIPTPEEILELNRKIHAWADEREHVQILPLYEWHQQVIRGKEVTAFGDAGVLDPAVVLQKDGLHPSNEGMDCIVRGCLHCLVHRFRVLSASDIRPQGE
jgi:hypothetical protein